MANRIGKIQIHSWQRIALALQIEVTILLYIFLCFCVFYVCYETDHLPNQFEKLKNNGINISLIYSITYLCHWKKALNFSWNEIYRYIAFKEKNLKSIHYCKNLTQNNLGKMLPGATIQFSFPKYQIWYVC